MKLKTIRVSGKGQIALPVDIRHEAGIEQGDELLLVQEGPRILMEKTENAASIIREGFHDFLLASEKVLAKDWAAEEGWEKLLPAKRRKT